MHYKKLLFLFFILFLIQGCHFIPTSSSHQLVIEKAIIPEQYMRYWSFEDINQDGKDEFIIVENYRNNCQSFLVKNQNTDIHSQINIRYPINSYKIIRNPYDNTKWLFYSFNDGKNCYLHAVNYEWGSQLKREVLAFQLINRTDKLIGNPNYNWIGSLNPIFMEDINNDKRVEVVCTGNDAFPSNPRGLFIFDLITGELKWRFDTACNISNIIYHDFDGDGVKDFIVSTKALKNNLKTINGTTDFSTFIFVCNNAGKLIYLEKCFDGYGEVFLEYNDLNVDGYNEIIKVEHTWGTNNTSNSISIIASNKKQFVTKKRYVTETTLSRQCKMFVTNLDESNEKYIFLSDNKDGLIILNKDLNLVKTNLNLSVKRVESIDDIDNDNKKEILILGGNNEFIVLNHLLKVEARINNPFVDNEETKASIIKNGTEEPKRIAILCNNGVNYYQYKFLPWYLLLWRWFVALLPVIFCLMLVIILIQFVILLMQKKRNQYFLVNYIQV